MKKTPKMSVKQVLSGRPSSLYTVPKSASVQETIHHIVSNKTSSSLVLGVDGEVAGIVTARDLLKFTDQLASSRTSNHGVVRGVSAGVMDALHAHKVAEVMTPVDKMIYCSPKDTVKRCREVMFQMKIRHMPVLEGKSVLGIVTNNNLSDAEFNNELHGGKKGYISNVIGRKGLPRDAHICSSVNSTSSVKLPLGQQSCSVRTGSYTLPHPFKTKSGVASNRRQYGSDSLCMDNELNEDAHFVMTVDLPNVNASPDDPNRNIHQVYACVADGVGSWRQYDIDPRMYSHKLVENAKNAIESESSRLLDDYMLSVGSGLTQSEETIYPLDAIQESWFMTNKDQEILGSSTICIATIDVTTNQLFYSNIGDGGLMVVRHVPTDGTLNAKVASTTYTTQTVYNNTNYKIAYLAQQQLRSFNLPFQLGNGGSDYDGHFEEPKDADTASIPLMPNDVVVLASDGLFDNLEISEMISIISEWEQKGGNFDKDLSESGNCSDSNLSYDEKCQALAKRLVLAAREASLDNEKDSPFALLAKENDIMWGGGMPDDTTVVIMHLSTEETSQ